MKKCIVFLLAVILCSCHKEASVVRPAAQEQESFEQLISSIHELNNQYGFTETKSPVGVIASAADCAGGILGNMYGAGVGAWVGGAAGPVGSVVGYLAGRRFGGYIGAAVFSGAVHLVDCFVKSPIIREDTPLILMEGPGLLLMDYVYPPRTAAQREDLMNAVNNATPGNLHNILLYCLQCQGLSKYVNLDGSVNAGAMYDDLVLIAEDLGLPVEEDINDYKPVVISYTSDVVAETKNANRNNTDSYTYSLKLYNHLVKHGLPSSDVAQLASLHESISAASFTSDAQASQYEQQCIQLIADSDLSEDKKTGYAAFASIAVRSTEYWYPAKTEKPIIRNDLEPIVR